MQYVLALVIAGATLWLLHVWKVSKTLPPGASAGSPAALAESLTWYDGDLSPNGRKVLWVEPAATTLNSATRDSRSTEFFARGCPVDPDALRTKLPDSPVKEKVHWALTEEEIERVRAGFTPEVLEDKWRIVALRVDGAERVFFLRSWTGAVSYVVDLGEHGVRWVWRSADDPLGVELARAVTDGYLLGRTCVVPAPKSFGEDKTQLMAWGLKIAGRHCKAVEPCVG